MHLNPVVVTIALMFWGWLWGGMGLILAVPITAGIKAVCDNVQKWRPTAASWPTSLSQVPPQSFEASRPP